MYRRRRRNDSNDLSTSADEARPAVRETNRLGVIGGFVFVATLVAQNVTRGMSNVSNRASGAAVIRDYAQHRSVHWALAVMFVVGAFGLVTLVATLEPTARRPSALPIVSASSAWSGSSRCSRRPWGSMSR